MNLSNPSYWNKYYSDTPDDKIPWSNNGQMLLDEVLSMMQIHTALDVGCGVGLKLHYLLSKGIDAYGLDISEVAIGKSLTKKAYVCAIEQISDLDIVNRKYDLILDILSSQFVHDRSEYVRWVKDHLNRDGLFVIVQFFRCLNLRSDLSEYSIEYCELVNEFRPLTIVKAQARLDGKKPTIKAIFQCKS